MPPAPWLLALGLVLGLLVLLPARRLQLAGLAPRTIWLLALTMWTLGMFVAIRPVAARVLVPILLIAYLAPFVTAPDRMGRIMRRGAAGSGSPSKPPIKNVTPTDPPEPRDPPEPPDRDAP